MDKTKVVKLGYWGPLVAADNMSNQNQNVEIIKSSCDLGVLLTPRLSVNRYLQFMKTKALSSVNSINSKIDL